MTVIAKELKADILARQPDALGNAKVVFRPDSGDPVKILTGYTDEELVQANGKPAVSETGQYTVKATGESISEAERTGAVECLWNIYGGTTTEKGYKVLDSHVGLIYGDSITLGRGRDIMLRLAAKGFASCNVVLGIGSYVYGMNSRDTFGYALKAIYAEVGGEAVDIYKDPATDDGTKKSAKGLLRVEQEGGRFVLYEQQTVEQAEGGALIPVFRNGELLVRQSLAEIRERLQSSWTCPAPGSIVWD
jgi:nicotinamide phosphoribosyltransferase